MAHPFRTILKYAVGDFVAKALGFVAFIHLVRVLQPENLGILEFALSVLSYFLLFGDGGLDVWATREAARGKLPMRELAGRVLPLRLGFALLSFGVLIVLLPVFPRFPSLKPVLVLFGLVLFAQATNMQWAFMGKEKMGRVGVGLTIGQIIFAVSVLAFIRQPQDLIWVPVMRLVGDATVSIFFARLFAMTYGSLRLPLTLRGTREVLKPALTIGAAHGLGLLSYNFDTLLLGFMLGSTEVAMYSAAYRPITAVLVLPISFFMGVFPILSRLYAQDRDQFKQLVTRSLQLTCVFAMPLGVGALFLARPAIGLLFGSEYEPAVLVLQILAWSGVLVIMRGTFRQSINAACKPGLDLRIASTSIAVNVGLNLVLIPKYGVIGAAAATLISEVVWISMVTYGVQRHVVRLDLWSFLWQPVVAVVAMGVWLWYAQWMFWIVRGAIGLVIYLGVVVLLVRSEIRSWLDLKKVSAN